MPTHLFEMGKYPVKCGCMVGTVVIYNQQKMKVFSDRHQ